MYGASALCAVRIHKGGGGVSYDKVCAKIV